MPGLLRSPWPLCASFALHAGVLWAMSTPPPSASPRALPTAETSSNWSGDTFDVDVLEKSPSKASPSRAAVPQAPAPEPTRPTAPAPQALKVPQPATATHPAAPPAAVAPKPPPRAEAPRPASSVAAGPGGDAPGRSAGGSYGAAGLPAGVSDLGRAFTRSLPAAVSRIDNYWQSTQGVVARARVTFRVGEDGKITELEIHQPEPPGFLKELLRRSRLLLGRGRFALRADAREAGEQTFELEVTFSRRAPSDDPFAEPHHIMARGYTPPALDRPGTAYCTTASGQHVEVVVRIAEHSGDDG